MRNGCGARRATMGIKAQRKTAMNKIRRRKPNKDSLRSRRAVPFITLLDEAASPIPEADLSLTIDTNVGSSYYQGLASKGKRKVFEEREVERPRGTKLDEEGFVPDCEILGENMAKGDHIYTGQVFVDKEAFKLHMSLYAIANKFSYRVKRSEPGKMVLECSGNNCVSSRNTQPPTLSVG
ncbi:hypothetical protein F2Q69_00044619 [Brassica cretica]|uniref:Transposase MuDR plant domain-containing protein n=1 Tax=Brassica cretica TaxID=69181 RepID=A0A8S9N9N3_BRACR|nr:hypothetical protein F2Q69_00044619 [Brassica cretica]